MAKDNLFLGFGRGSVGDVTFSRLNGQQVARARNRHPNNPQTMPQVLQRVVMKTVSSAYSFLSGICDHSFEGQQGVTANQSRFVKLNVSDIRNRPAIAEVLQSGDESDYTRLWEGNFNKKNSYGCEFNDYIISEGSLRSIDLPWFSTSAQSYGFEIVGFPALSESTTYLDVITGLGLQRGDQLTFVQLTTDDTEESNDSMINGMQVARVILDPASGELDTPFVTIQDGFGDINDPNPRNEGIVQLWDSGNGKVTFAVSASMFAYGYPFPIQNGRPATICAAAIIVSRQSGGKWLRSSAKLSVRPDTTGAGSLAWDAHQDYMGYAISSFLPSSDSRSLLYLNQAEGASSRAQAPARLVWELMLELPAEQIVNTDFLQCNVELTRTRVVDSVITVEDPDYVMWTVIESSGVLTFKRGDGPTTDGVLTMSGNKLRIGQFSGVIQHVYVGGVQLG